MRKLLLLTILTLTGLFMRAEQISNVETSGSWVYLSSKGHSLILDIPRKHRQLFQYSHPHALPEMPFNPQNLSGFTY